MKIPISLWLKELLILLVVVFITSLFFMFSILSGQDWVMSDLLASSFHLLVEPFRILFKAVGSFVRGTSSLPAFFYFTLFLTFMLLSYAFRFVERPLIRYGSWVIWGVLWCYLCLAANAITYV